MRKRNPSGKRAKAGRRGVIVLSTAAFVLLAVTVAIWGYVFHLLDFIQVSEDGISISQKELEQYLKSEMQQDVSLTEPDILLDDPQGDSFQDENVVNILLVGQDARPGESRARADAILMCSFHKEKKQLTVVSFMRDLYVQIPGYPDHKLNAAFAWGGMELLCQTLQVNFGVEIDGGFSVDFSSFETVIDEIGGVDVYLTAEEADYLNRYQYTEGMNHLNGAAALTYARIRGIGNGDFDRTVRQQNIIHAVLEKYKTISIKDRITLLEAVLPYLSTNMDKWEILRRAVQLMPAAYGLEMKGKIRVPAEGTYAYEWVDGMSVLLPDLSKNKEILGRLLYS